jgi:predicted RNA binding protein YcfA (HicA-like mRNA interferase family)
MIIEMSLVPNHNERQLMQRLRGQGWVRRSVLPPSRMIDVLLKKGWIEGRGLGRDVEYRITDEGMIAKKALIPRTASKQKCSGHDTGVGQPSLE